MKKLFLAFCLCSLFSLCDASNGTYTVDSHGCVTVGKDLTKNNLSFKPSKNINNK